MIFEPRSFAIAHTDVSESVSPDDDPFGGRAHDILKIDLYAKRGTAIDALIGAARTPGRAQPTPRRRPRFSTKSKTSLTRSRRLESSIKPLWRATPN
jgi:hypothetical protein